LLSCWLSVVRFQETGEFGLGDPQQRWDRFLLDAERRGDRGVVVSAVAEP